MNGERDEQMSNFVFDLQLFNDYNVVNIKGVINNVAAGDTFTVDYATYTVLSFNDDSITAAVEGTPADNLGTSIAINSTKTINGIDGADITSEQLFKLSGISTPTGITINEKVVNVSNDNLDGSTVSIDGDDYTLALANTVPEPASISTDPITITSTNNTISADGVYQFASDFTGTVTIAERVTNVKLIGAGSQVEEVYIDASATSNLNLWIQDLDIKSSNMHYNVIKFGKGTNYLTVEGTNNLINSATHTVFTQALINVGDGLNIIGDGELSAKLTGAESYGAAIGSDGNSTGGAINIGGKVTVTAQVTGGNGNGAGIGSGFNGTIGNISIGGNAIINASRINGSTSYGKGATVNGNKGTVANGTADSLTTPTEIGYAWTTLDEGKSTYKKLSTTAGYELAQDAKSISYKDAQGNNLFTLSGIANTDGITVKDGVVTISKDNLSKNPTPEGFPTIIENGTASIKENGIYKFADDFTGTITIGATNIKLIGADVQLKDVSINIDTVESANLWIKDLNIQSSETNSVIKFGNSTSNYLTVEGKNSLENTASANISQQALINVGGGLNIYRHR